MGLLMNENLTFYLELQYSFYLPASGDARGFSFCKCTAENSTTRISRMLCFSAVPFLEVNILVESYCILRGALVRLFQTSNSF